MKTNLEEKIERTKVTLVYWIIVTFSLFQMTLMYRGLIMAAMVTGAFMLREEWDLEHLEEAKERNGGKV
jgi:chromate transport protein ChrA